MRLQEVLQTVPQDARLKIGAQRGSGYFYVGAKSGIDFESIDDQLKKRAEVLYRNQLKAKKERGNRKPDSKEAARLKRAIDGYRSYIPVAEREVDEVFESVADVGALCVIVEGSGEGQEYVIETRPIRIDNEEAAWNLLGAIYKEPVGQLQKDYERLYYADMASRSDLLYTIYREEDRLTSGICRMARMEAVKKICAENKGRSVSTVNLEILYRLGRDESGRQVGEYT